MSAVFLHSPVLKEGPGNKVASQSKEAEGLTAPVSATLPLDPTFQKPSQPWALASHADEPRSTGPALQGGIASPQRNHFGVKCEGTAQGL